MIEKTEFLGVRVHLEHKQGLAAWCQQNECGLSEVVRALIDNFLMLNLPGYERPGHRRSSEENVDGLR